MLTRSPTIMNSIGELDKVHIQNDSGLDKFRNSEDYLDYLCEYFLNEMSADVTCNGRVLNSYQSDNHSISNDYLNNIGKATDQIFTDDQDSIEKNQIRGTKSKKKSNKKLTLSQQNQKITKEKKRIMRIIESLKVPDDDVRRFCSKIIFDNFNSGNFKRLKTRI